MAKGKMASRRRRTRKAKKEFRRGIRGETSEEALDRANRERKAKNRELFKGMPRGGRMRDESKYNRRRAKDSWRQSFSE